MKELNNDRVLSALRRVKDPDLQKDIVSLGFVKDLVIEGRDISLTIELTTPACPVREELQQSAVDEIRKEIPDAGKVDISLTSRVRAHQTGKPTVLPGVKNTIAVASGKGGVGKSTIAVNLAVALAAEGAQVGLVDLDVYGPSIPIMMGVTGRPAVRGQKIQPMEGYGVKIMSIGFFVEPMQAMIWRGPMASGTVQQFMKDVEWGDLDYLMFDLPPGTGDVQLTLAQMIPLTGAVVVTTPQDISLADARKAYAMFTKVNVPILGLVENMSFHICPNCGHRDEIFDFGGGEREAEKLGIPFLGRVPLVTGIRASGDRGKPAVLESGNTSAGDDLRRIARSMAAQVSIRNERQEEDIDIELLGQDR